VGLNALAADYLSPSTPFTYSSGCNTFTNTTINVTETTPILDLDVGLISTIDYRMDTVLDLTSPQGTTVRLLNGTGVNTQRANYNVLFDDSAPNLVDTAPHDTPDTVGATPYENPVQPVGTLADFNGENPAGNWTFAYCDQFPGDGGATVNRMELLLADPSEIDLALVASTSGVLTVGNVITVDVDISNSRPVSATGVTGSLTMGSGLTIQSVSGASYNSVTGIFTLGALAGNSSTVVSVDVLIENTGVYSFTSEIETASPTDADSTPGNGVTTEDDYSTFTFTPGQGQPGNPPALECALNEPPNVLDWTLPGGPQGWPAGDLTPRTFTINGVPVEISFGGPTAAFVASGGSDTPVTNTTLTGGNSPAPEGLMLAVQYASLAQAANPLTVTFAFGAPIGGVGGIRIPIYDVDLGGWTDEIQVVGTQSEAGGGTVTRTPFLTASSSNQVVGSSVVGTADSGSTSSNGNMWINFEESVDTVTISYGNLATTDPPAFQFISIGNFEYCDPETPDLTAAKSVETKVADAFSIPGESILYRITATSGTDANVDAEGVVIHDVLPDNLRFISATTTGFTGGTFNSPALPAVNTDCAGGTCEINFTGAILPRGTIGEVIIEAIIK
jgi:uncharacterized repeat protein (TIGR01451 family)